MKLEGASLGLDDIRPIVESSLEHAEQLINDLQENEGFLGWPENWVNAIEKMNLQWHQLYEGEYYFQRYY